MSVNKAIIIGNVGKEPDCRTLSSGTKVAMFTVATTERGYKLQNGTEVPERTEWHNVVVWRKLAEIVEQYVHKGSKLYIEGKIRTRSWDDKNGVKRYTTEIFADVVEMLGGNQNAVPQQQQLPNNAPVQVEAQPQQQQSTNQIPFVDDLPF